MVTYDSVVRNIQESVVTATLLKLLKLPQTQADLVNLLF